MSDVPSLSRRDWLRLSAAGVVGYSLSGWLQAFADQAARDPQRKRSCILLWMNGGPSQMDTFDLKPGHANGGTFKEIATAVPGIKISEHLPKIAAQMKNLCLLRGMATKEGFDTCKAGLGSRIARAIADAGVNVRGVSAAVVGNKFVAYFGFDSADDAAKAAKAIKSVGSKKK